MALRLDSERKFYRVVIDGPADRQGDIDVYEVLPSGDPQGVLFLEAGPDVNCVLLVETGLMVIRHPAHVLGIVATPAFVEYRLVDADGMRP